VEHARGADALLAEAAIERPDQDSPEPDKRGHMAPVELGEVARRAGVGRLLITHAPIDPGDPERAVREASAVYRGAVERVRDGERYAI
jgi:ribonuclease BN (tRNA processing enzyme)